MARRALFREGDDFISKLKEYVISPHIHLSLATGISIIMLAYFSKRVLPEPIPYLQLAIPPFFMTIWEGVQGNEKYARISNPVYWIAAILISTVVVIRVNF